jgi:hypothetical protein
MRFKCILFLICICLVDQFGCSNQKLSVISDLPTQDQFTLSDVHSGIQGNVSGNSGIMGAYQLTIDTLTQNVQLVPKRASAIGEDYIVSGIGFFTSAPCPDCLKLDQLAFLDNNLILTFFIRHPFPPGKIADPPSAVNRLDLNVFDLAMIVYPQNVTASSFTLTDTYIYDNVISNPSGYTTELANVVYKYAAMPYVLVVDESAETVHSWNKFAMGDSREFDVEFTLDTYSTLYFNLYLTMGYGASAKKPQRLEPKYYNPEFNRKSAWKVEVAPSGNWLHNDSTTPVNVEIRVYDWQCGATVYPFPSDFQNAPANNVYQSSEIERVSLEIPGMNNSLLTSDTPVSGSGMPGDPMIFQIPVTNQNLLPQGKYTGLVKVTDERPCLPPASGRDFLIDSPDGIALNNFSMEEYATYQTFNATVAEGAPPCNGFCWVQAWGGASMDESCSVKIDNFGNSYVAGYFQGTVEFNPEGGGLHSSSGLEDVFLSKFDSSGNWQWTKTWGGTGSDYGWSVAIDGSGYLYVTGEFTGSVQFNPDGGGTQASEGSWDAFLSKFDSNGNWQWTRTWGGTSSDAGNEVASNSSDEVYVAGYFNNTVEFNPTGGGSHASHGGNDAFLSQFDSNGNWQWTATWGGTLEDRGISAESTNSGYTYVTGDYQGTVEFNPSGGGSDTSYGGPDPFLSKFASDGSWQWSRTWGGTGLEGPYCVALSGSGDIFVAGFFQGTVQFNPPGGGSQSSNGADDAFLSKFNQNGNWLWTQTWGGTDSDAATSVVVSSSNAVFVTGYFSSTVEFNPYGGDFHSSNGWYDAYLSRFDTNGNWQWTKNWGGLSFDAGNSVAVTGSGNAHVTGFFSQTVEFNPDGGESRSANGSLDAFLVSMNY